RGRADVVAADGEHQGAAGDGVLDDAAVEAEDGADVLLGEHLGRGAAGVQAASGQGDEVVGVAGGEVEVVQDHHDGGAAVAVQVGQQVEDLDLVAGVEERGGLVEQEQVGLLGQRHGDPDALPLAAGELVDGPVGQVRRAGGLQGGRHRGVVGGGPSGEDPLVRVAAPADEVEDGDAFGGDRRLGQQPERAGEL